MPDAILAIETSTALGGVAVVRDGEVCFEKTFSSERSHNSQLFAPLREALAVAGDTLRAVVVGTGPASYTGVRIGIAAAQGIAVSREVPVIGLPSVLSSSRVNLSRPHRPPFTVIVAGGIATGWRARYFETRSAMAASSGQVGSATGAGRDAAQPVIRMGSARAARTARAACERRCAVDRARPTARG